MVIKKMDKDVINEIINFLIAILIITLIVTILGIFIPLPFVMPISIIIPSSAALIGGLVALKEYRLKVKAEIRLTESANLEADIKLIKLFTEIMNIAHGRAGSYVSENAIEIFLSQEDIKTELSQELIDPPRYPAKSKIEGVLESSVINLPVGKGAQNAAITSIGVLGERYEILRPVAIDGLEVLTKFKDEEIKAAALKYINNLNSKDL